MDVMQSYSQKSVKLGSVPAGGVVLLQFNDGRYDNNLYMVLFDEHDPEITANLVNLHSGKLVYAHTSTRVISFPKAYVHLNND